MPVQTIPPIDQMTPLQRVELMEELWKVMSQNPDEIEAPEWHLKVLEERDRAVANGETDFIDWEDAKEQIRKETIDRNR